MKIGIVGLGAIGGWVGARLALAGHPVSALVRASSSAPLTLHDGPRTQQATIVRSSDAMALGPQDLLILAVKAPALASAVEAAAPMIGAGTLVLSMLNGVPWWFMGGTTIAAVDPAGRIAALVPPERTIGCVVHASVHRDDPDTIRVRSAERLIIGEPDGGHSARVDRLCGVFADAGIAADADGDIRRAIWYKLWGNMSFNPLSALTLATTDRIMADPDTRAFVLACMAEAATIGAAVGCPIAQSGEDRLEVTSRLGGFKTSMLQDVEAGRPIELEALLGAPLELARAYGIAAPSLSALYGMTRLFGESRGLL